MSTLNNSLKNFIAITLIGLSSHATAESKLTIFAAASMTNAIHEISAVYEKEKNIKVMHSFAASSTLAKQIENGAPADVFISADTKWMNYLQEKNAIDKSSRVEFLGNKLVLITPKGQGFKVTFDTSADFSKTFHGKLCTGDVESVPVGIYARHALTYYGWWDAIKTRVVGAQDVRGALAFVERGECVAGIVYETDAKVSSKVDVVATFPQNSHPPVVYPIAVVSNSKAVGGKNTGREYIQFLQSKEALDIFRKYGFNVLFSIQPQNK